MSLFVVILPRPSEHIWERVGKVWPATCYFASDYTAFVSPDSGQSPQAVADLLGFNTEGRVRGTVVEMADIAGYGDSDLVEWVKAHK